ncbi:hypothetical protein [uncultured Campylobacter sp.]|uniref:hypothetical protein n=1 Tax=uncultured Campylobacter sp. TaxID=218934 RepID=UPI00260D124E|nr:hypothetical protein [uncultured Campylobacter sp.]
MGTQTAWTGRGRSDKNLAEFYSAFLKNLRQINAKFHANFKILRSKFKLAA